VHACELFSPVGLLFFSFRHFGPWVLFTCGINFRCLRASEHDYVLSESDNVGSKRQLYNIKYESISLFGDFACEG